MYMTDPRNQWCMLLTDTNEEMVYSSPQQEGFAYDRPRGGDGTICDRLTVNDPIEVIVM